MNGFFDELQRRKVYRVAAAYIIVAAGVIQLASAAFPAWDLPSWALRLVIVLLLVGFPIALMLAWAYDITAQGVRATPTIAMPRARRRRNIVILVTTGVAISAAAAFFLLPRAVTRKIDKSIAVLPFQNLSDEKENAYFADGIQDDILTNLSKIADLKVISRMSVMPYRGDGPRNAREIGKALGVGALLEGSVRRVGNRVRVSVQLINANDDEHIWAEDYDRDLTDVFAIQTDLARKIASTLQAKFSQSEKARIDRMPTQNLDAYLLYIQAHDYANRPDKPRETTLKAEQLFEQAINLDRNFAAAYAGLSMVESWLYHDSDPVPMRREKARVNANEALRFQPDLPEGHLALGYSYYYGDRNYERALAEFEIAKRDLPNEAQAYLAIAAIQRRQGKWAESNANFEKSIALDPKNISSLFNLASSYMAQRNFETADKIFDRALLVAPQSYGSRGMKGGVAIMWKGDIRAAEKQVSLMPPDYSIITAARTWILILQRKFGDALQLVQQSREETLSWFNPAPCPKAFLEGRLYLYQGDKIRAQTAFEQARPVAEKLVNDAPGDAARHGQLGAVLAGLGLKENAIIEGKKAVGLVPESEDAFDGPKATAALAEIYAWVGENDEALRLIDHLLQVPSFISVQVLKLDPVWDPLRKDPRFQALIDKYAVNR
jgi:TolB-like protein/Flp pilus assembly protein TadD